MDTSPAVISLDEIVAQAIAKYNNVWPGYSYSLIDSHQRHYAVLAFPESRARFPDTVNIVVAARIAGEQIIIDHDATNRPLVQALVEAGIPRARIILAYRDEPLPTGYGPEEL
jgi:hypothetical protein